MTDTQQAIAWFKDRAKNTPMAGARSMFQAALEALEEKAERGNRSPAPDLAAVTRCKDCILRSTPACVLDGLYYKINKDHDFCSYGRKE